MAQSFSFDAGTLARQVFSLRGLSVLFMLFLLVFSLFPDVLATHSPTALDIRARLAPPSPSHFLGTDEAGRDLYSRIVYGTRYSVGTSLAIILGAALVGTLYGAIAGMSPPEVDNVLMRIVDVFMGFPALILALAVAAAVGRGLQGVFVSLLLIWWPSYARHVRGEVRRLRELPHVEAAIALGASSTYLLRHHILPFLVQDVNVRMTTDVGYALIAVTALSFLGLGVQSPTPEWGLLIRDSRTYFGSAWWYLVFPGVMVMLTATAFSIVGDHIAARRGRRAG